MLEIFISWGRPILLQVSLLELVLQCPIYFDKLFPFSLTLRYFVISSLISFLTYFFFFSSMVFILCAFVLFLFFLPVIDF